MASETFCQIAFQRSGTNSQCHHSVVRFPDGQPGLGGSLSQQGRRGVGVCVCTLVRVCAWAVCVCV